METTSPVVGAGFVKMTNLAVWKGCMKTTNPCISGSSGPIALYQWVIKACSLVQVGHEDLKGRLLAVKTRQVALHEKLEINLSPVRTVAVVHRNFFHTAWRHNGHYFVYKIWSVHRQIHRQILILSYLPQWNHLGCAMLWEWLPEKQVCCGYLGTDTVTAVVHFYVLSGVLNTMTIASCEGIYWFTGKTSAFVSCVFSERKLYWECVRVETVCSPPWKHRGLACTEV